MGKHGSGTTLPDLILHFLQYDLLLTQAITSGVGLGICYRLIEDFLTTKPSTTQLTIIFTTRDSKKSADTLTALDTHLARARRRHAGGRTLHHIHFLPQNVDLTSLLSVRQLAYTLLRSQVPHLNAVIFNGGNLGLAAMNWPLAIWKSMTDTVNELTWPVSKLSAVGLVTQPQLQRLGSNADLSFEPPLGQLFASNVFGHYLLAHWLTPLLRCLPASTPGRMIWVGSIECVAQHFDPDDIQALRSPTAYEHSKRLTDLLAITAHNQPSTSRSVQSFLTPSDPFTRELPTSNPLHDTEPEIHVVHPAICVTNNATHVMPFPWILSRIFVMFAYVSRLLGSPWALVTGYNGAFAISWLALATTEEVEDKKMEDHVGLIGAAEESTLEARSGSVREVGGAVKWGSSTTVGGTLSVRKTEVECWGINGSGEPYGSRWWGGKMGRRRGAKDATAEDVERFMADGARAWREMETLRKEWEGRLEAYDKMQAGGESS